MGESDLVFKLLLQMDIKHIRRTVEKEGHALLAENSNYQKHLKGAETWNGLVELRPKVAWVSSTSSWWVPPSFHVSWHDKLPFQSMSSWRTNRWAIMKSNATVWFEGQYQSRLLRISYSEPWIHQWAPPTNNLWLRRIINSTWERLWRRWTLFRKLCSRNLLINHLMTFH